MLRAIVALMRRRPRSTSGNVEAPSAPAQAATIVASDLHAELFLKYRDSGGHVTDRMFTLHEVVGRGVGDHLVMTEMHGYCHLRRMARTFRVDRVVQAADADGVIIPDFVAWLRTQVR